MLTLKKEILKRIEENKKDLDKKSQRAELLIRNEKFQEELNKFINWLPDTNKFFAVKMKYPGSQYLRKGILRISKNNILIKLKYTKYKHKYWIKKENKDLNETYNFMTKYLQKEYKESKDEKYKLELEIDHRVKAYREHFEAWEKFCERWHVKSGWDGKLENLNKFMRNPVEIYYNTMTDRHNFEDASKWAFFLRINAWTTLEDIKDRWGTIERIQRKILGKPEKKANFSRDLCWYDLYKKYNLTPKQIAELWTKKCPEDIDILVIRRIKKIEKEQLSEEDELELLKEIKTDPNLNELRNEFEEEREAYINGKYPPFLEVIKKGIQRMEKQIKENIYPQPKGIDLIFLQRAKEIDNKLLIKL